MANEAEQPLWHWITDPKLLERKACPYCNEPMYKDRDSAVMYENKPAHSYCLMTFLTKFHQDHRYDAPSADEKVWSGNNWGVSP